MNLSHIYDGRMSVFEYSKACDEFGCTSLVKTLIYDNIPCLLSSMLSKRSNPRDSNTSVLYNKSNQVKKVFLDPQYHIKLGSFVSILQNGRVYEFEYSGEGFVYTTHQEIYLEGVSIA